MKAAPAKKSPIIFRGPMVRAILEGRKTQTRRVIKRRNGEYPLDFYDGMFWFADGDAFEIPCPYGIPGDRLWVREGVVTHSAIPQIVGYVADGCKRTEEWEKRHTARFMPRWASRIALEITDVRVQRVQDISEEDAEAEGIAVFERDRLIHAGEETLSDRIYIHQFTKLWDSIHGKKHPWKENPWVWAIRFQRVEL